MSGPEKAKWIEFIPILGTAKVRCPRCGKAICHQRRARGAHAAKCLQEPITFQDVKRIMEEPMKYDVEFKTPTREVKSKTYHVANPGVAFAECQKDNPGCTMLHATAQSGIPGFVGRTDYEPPPVQRDPVTLPRPACAPKPNDKDGVMPFYDAVKSEKPWN